MEEEMSDSNPVNFEGIQTLDFGSQKILRKEKKNEFFFFFSYLIVL